VRRVETSLDPIVIHPAFDIETKTWFEGNMEDKTISGLLVKLQSKTGKTIIAKDHYVDCQCPVPKFPETTLSEYLKRPISTAADTHGYNRIGPQKRMPPAPVDGAMVGPTGTPPHNWGGGNRKSPTREAKLRLDTKPPAAKDSSPVPVPGVRGALSFKSGTERNAIVNEVLDLWAAGWSGPAIAEKLNLTIQYVGAQIIPAARGRGDKRAVRRLSSNPRN
jgi:hypothetical protein